MEDQPPPNSNNNNNVPEIRNPNNNNVFIIPNGIGRYWMQKGFLGKCGTEIRKCQTASCSLFRNDATRIETTFEKKILCILGFYQLTIKGFETGIKWEFLRQKTYYDKKGVLQREFNSSFFNLIGGNTGEDHPWFTVTNMDAKLSARIVKLKPAGTTQFQTDAVKLRNDWFPQEYREIWAMAVDSDESEFSNQIYTISEAPSTNIELCHRLCAFYCKNPRSQKTLIFLYNNPGYQEGAIIRSHGWHEEPAANTVAEAGSIQDRRQRQNSYLKGLGDTHHVTDKYTYNAGADFMLRIKKKFWIEVPTGFGYENGMP